MANDLREVSRSRCGHGREEYLGKEIKHIGLEAECICCTRNSKVSGGWSRMGRVIGNGLVEVGDTHTWTDLVWPPKTL